MKIKTHSRCTLASGALLIFSTALVFMSTVSYAELRKGTASCQQQLTQSGAFEVLGKNIFKGSIFYDSKTAAELYPSYARLRWMHERTSKEAMKAKRASIKKESNYAVEALPLVIRKEVAEILIKAAAQRAKAANEFLKDIYRNKNSQFVAAHPEFEAILKSSPMFVQEIVGSAAVQNEPFNFSLAMDVVLTENPDGTQSFAILESDSGNIGGNFRMAQVAQGLHDIWPQARIFDDFRDARESLWARMDREANHAKAFPDVPNGRTILFAEDESAFAEKGDTNMKRWLAEHNILLVSRYNRHELIFNEKEQRYYFRGHPITNFWLSYNTEPFDPLSPSFQRVSKSIQDDPFERSHTMPGHWERWLNGGYKNWRQLNPQGIEIFTDKAISGAIPLAERLYLNREPVIGGNAYENVLKSTPEETQQFIDRMFTEQATSVAKSRSESGQGKGVYVGNFLTDGKTKNGLTWEALKKEVERDPLDWVKQPFMRERPLILNDGRARTWELRLITNFDDGVPYVLAAIYIRSAAVGTMRNMSGTKDVDSLSAPSIVPVLIPK